jgi:hypothetical protein
MKRTQLNLALLVVAAGLGVAVFFSQKKEEKGPPLTAIEPGALTRIALEHPGVPAIRLEKRDGGWFFTEPVQGEVDELEVNALVSLAGTERKETLEGAKLAELELDPPRYTVTLNDTPIAFGGVEPLNYRRYVKVGDIVGLIDDPPSAALDRDYADLVAKSLVPAAAAIERIELPKLTLAQADGKWTLSPADPKAGADQMQKLADAWKNARAMWNESAPQAPPAKAERVKVTLKDGSVREFVVAATEPQFKLYRPELRVNLVLSKALADELLKLPDPPPPEPATAPGEAGAAAPDSAPGDKPAQ